MDLPQKHLLTFTQQDSAVLGWCVSWTDTWTLTYVCAICIKYI